jgi:hypothetical protein
MSTVREAPAPVTPGSPEDPYRLGWRMVRQVGPDGEEAWVQVPLTQEDVLHPQEEDFIVQNPLHNRDCRYLEGALRGGAAHLPGALVLHDERTDFEVAGVRPLGPDFGVYSGVAGEVTQGTFLVASRGARPELVVEVTSPSTRINDFGEKVGLYFQAGVPLYVIVDHHEDEGAVGLVGHQATPEGYVPMRPDGRGRLWLAPVRLWLAVEGGRAVCYDEHGKRIPDPDDSLQETREARAEAAEEARARRQAEADKEEEARARQRLEAEKAKAEADSADLAARMQRLEAEKAKAEADSADLAARVKQLEADKAEEARARQKADADRDARMQQMEAELRRLRGEG